MKYRRGYHHSEDPRDHYCVHGFHQDRHVYKTLHIYSFGVSRYYKKGGGQFAKNLNMLDLALECVDLGYIIFLSKNQPSFD